MRGVITLGCGLECCPIQTEDGISEKDRGKPIDNCIGYSISSVVETRDRVPSCFYESGFYEVVFRCFPHQWCFVVTRAVFEQATPVI